MLMCVMNSAYQIDAVSFCFPCVGFVCWYVCICGQQSATCHCVLILQHSSPLNPPRNIRQETSGLTPISQIVVLSPRLLFDLDQQNIVKISNDARLKNAHIGKRTSCHSKLCGLSKDQLLLCYLDREYLVQENWARPSAASKETKLDLDKDGWDNAGLASSRRWGKLAVERTFQECWFVSTKAS